MRSREALHNGVPDGDGRRQITVEGVDCMYVCCPAHTKSTSPDPSKVGGACHMKLWTDTGSLLLWVTVPCGEGGGGAGGVVIDKINT